MTCTAMFGSGVKIGLEIILIAQSRILRVPLLARAARAVAAVGSATPGLVGRRTAAGTPRRFATASAAFVFP